MVGWPDTITPDQFTILRTDPFHSISGKFVSQIIQGFETVTIAGVLFSIDYLLDPSQTFIDHVVLTQIGAATQVMSSANPSVFGQSVKFTATIPGTGAGKTVIFFNDGVSLGTGVYQGDVSGRGTFTLSTAALTIGDHTITANSSDGSSGSLTQTVTQDSPTVTLTSSSPSNTSSQGDPVTFTVKVMPNFSGNPTGFVDFFDGINFLGTQQLTSIPGGGGGGQASLTTSFQVLGNHSITANYRGDTNFAAKLSNAVNQNVVVNTKPATTTTVTSNTPNPSLYGQTVTLKATVTSTSGTPSGGTVTFYSDGVPITGSVTFSAGVYTLTVSKLPVGVHSITASYSGDTTFAGSTSTTGLTQTVTQVASTMSAIALSTTNANQSLTISVTLPAVPGGDFPTGNVTFTIDSTVYTVTIVNGVASFTLPAGLAVGSHTFKAVYNGDTNYTGSSSGPVTRTFASAPPPPPPPPPPPGRGT